MLVASTIGQIGHPFYVAFAWLLAEIYSAIPNYAIAIALLTIAVMIVVFPITLKGTRGMMKMQLLAPEMKKIQARHKVTPGMTLEERSEARRALNEEMMALYKENNTSPTGGCLPMFLQMPMFLILYGTIRGLTHVEDIKQGGKIVKTVTDPLYISHTSRLYHSIINAHGALHAFGINLADSVRSSGLSGTAKIPYIALILVAVGLQYLQMKQLSGRNPAARQANPQMQQMQKIFPLVFALIYISIPAGVNVYFIVSSLFRVGQQEFMYRRDPQLQASMAQLHARHAGTGKVVDVKAGREARPVSSAPPAGRLARFRAAAAAFQNPGQDDAPTAAPQNAATPGGAGNGAGNGTGAGAAATNGRRPGERPRPMAKGAPPPPAKPSHPRATAKRPRRPR